MYEIRPVEPHELLDCARLASVCFEYPLDTDKDAEAFYKQLAAEAPDALDKGDAHPLTRYGAFRDGRLTAAVSALPYKVDFDGTESAMCGIGAVCSHPAYRRGGAVRDIMLRILRDELAKGTEWSVLYPFSQAFYEKFGYVQSEPTCQTRFSLRYAVKPEAAGQFELYEGNGDYQGFREAYERMRGYNLKLRRDHCDYAKLRKANPYKTNDFAYLCRNAQGEAAGYFIFHKHKDDDSLMEVQELVFDSFDTLRQIIGFAAGFQSDYGDIAFTAPLRLCTEPLCSDVSKGYLRRTIQPNGMLRVIHAENALRKAAYRGTGEAVLEIHDAPLAITQRLCVRHRDGKLTDIGTTTLEPHLHLTVGAFSAALIGRFDTEEFPDALAGIFYKKPGYLINYF